MSALPPCSDINLLGDRESYIVYRYEDVSKVAQDSDTSADTVDDFDLFRPRTPNLTFAGGAHARLGQLLARAEMEIALNLVIDRLPDLRFDPEQRDETFMTGETWRSPNKLPVLWNPA